MTTRKSQQGRRRLPHLQPQESPFSHKSTIFAFGLHSETTNCKAPRVAFKRPADREQKTYCWRKGGGLEQIGEVELLSSTVSSSDMIGRASGGVGDGETKGGVRLSCCCDWWCELGF
ncbi:hypothetical protein Syun_016218 [Stephania yunnanensis]|uniref:Uncharacterized protein n=1 Tax=Stephania yunnanensis TaxID=152371 RepID=A0AAP0P4N6_9MAGN